MFAAAFARLSPDEESDLKWALSDAPAELGERSWLGPLIDRARAGQIRCQSSPQIRDVGPAAVRFGAVMDRLDAVRATGVDLRPALAFYTRFDARGPDPDRKRGDPAPDHGHVAPPLASLGDIGRVMVLLSDRPVAELEADAKKARVGKPGAVARLEELRGRAEEAMGRFRAAYVATRPPPNQRARERAETARRARAAERRGHYGGRVEGGEVVFLAGRVSSRRVG